MVDEDSDCDQKALKAELDNHFHNFEMMVEDIANPFVSEPLKQELSKIRQKHIHRGFRNLLSSIACAKSLKNIVIDIMTLLKKINLSKEYLLEYFQKIQEISEKPNSPIEMYNELSFFFNLTFVKNLENLHVKSIIKFISKEELENLRDYFAEMSNIDELKDELRYMKYQYNLNTLLSELIENKPKKKDDILYLWEQSDDYFINKTFNMEDPLTGVQINGIIKTIRRKGNEYRFNIQDKHRVRIEKINAQIKIEYYTKSQTKIINALKEMSEVNEKFEIMPAPGANGKLNEYLEIGKYKICGNFQNNSWRWKKILGRVISCCKNKFSYKLELEESQVIISKNIQNNSYENPRKVGNKEMDSKYVVLKRMRGNIKLNSHNELAYCLKIIDMTDDNALKAIHLQSITEKTEGLRLKLLIEEFRGMLYEFIDDLIQNKLKKISGHLFENYPNFSNYVKEICDDNLKYLDRRIDYKELAKNLMIEALYSHTIGKIKSLEIARTMELLKESYIHLDKIKGKNLIFFIGNTGSGKSCTVNFFLGTELISFINRVGEKVYDVDKKNAPRGNYPIIGQSLGESETLYAQGYPLPKFNNFCLTDCPGFNDTRGGHYELCTNISIDTAVTSSSSIHCIVLVMSVQSFLLDRANPVYELAVTVKERFSELFKKDSAENSKLFIAVTKSSYVNSAILKKIKDGTRFNELYKESINKLNELQSNPDSDPYQIEMVRKRSEVWHTFKKIHEEERIDFIDLLNNKRSEVIIQKYINSKGSLNKRFYCQFMESPEIKHKFGSCISMSTHTWTTLIINRYLFEIPSLIKGFNEQIRIIKKKIEDIEKDTEKKNQMIKINNDEIFKNETLIKSLNKLLHSGEGDSKEILKNLGKQINVVTSEHIENLRSNIASKENDLKKENKKIEELKSSVKKLQKEIIDLEIEKRRLEAEKDNLLVGFHKEVIYEYCCDPESTATIRTIRDSCLDEAFNEMRELREDEILSRENVKIKDLRGEYSITIRIKKNYRLVPEKPEDRKYFEMYNNFGEDYVATITSSKIRPDFKTKVNIEGNFVMYRFYEIFDDSGDLPCMKIEWKVPNLSYNEHEIINKISDIKNLEEKINRCERSLDQPEYGENAEIAKCENKIQAINREIQNIKTELEKEEKVKKKEELKKNIIEKEVDCKKRIEECKLIIKNNLLNIEANKKEIDIQNNRIKAEESNLENVLIQKKHLALIIVTQSEIATVIYRFSKIIISNLNPLISTKDKDVLKNCAEFQELYNRSFETILKMSKEDLDLK